MCSWSCCLLLTQEACVSETDISHSDSLKQRAVECVGAGKRGSTQLRLLRAMGQPPFIHPPDVPANFPALLRFTY